MDGSWTRNGTSHWWVWGFSSSLKQKQSQGPGVKHHKQVKLVQATFAKQVKALCPTLEEMGNPFEETSQDLLVIEKIGKQLDSTFDESRLRNRTESHFSPLKRNKLPLFSCPQTPSKSDDKKQITSLKKTCARFSRLCVVPSTGWKHRRILPLWELQLSSGTIKVWRASFRNAGRPWVFPRLISNSNKFHCWCWCYSTWWCSCHKHPQAWFSKSLQGLLRSCILAICPVSASESHQGWHHLGWIHPRQSQGSHLKEAWLFLPKLQPLDQGPASVGRLIAFWVLLCQQLQNDFFVSAVNVQLCHH